MAKELTFALAGNPNAGKSTVFNSLTGSRQHVGNWPGKTVEKKEGICKHGDREIVIVDLPGTYSLSAYSAEEVIARDFIIEERPDVVIAVVDAGNLERNLYLVVQILELGVPVVLALNMSRRRRLARHTHRHRTQLSRGLNGSPVVRTIASKGKGIDELLQAALQAAGVGEQDHGAT